MYLLGTHYVPGTVVRGGNTMNKRDTFPVITELSKKEERNFPVSPVVRTLLLLSTAGGMG